MRLKVSPLLFAFLILACSKSEEPEETQKDILGKWFYVSETYDGVKVTYPENCFTEQYYEFFSNGSLTLQLYTSACEDPENYIGNFTVNSGTLEVTGLQGSDDLNYSFNIVKLTSTTLIIEDQVMDDGEEVKYRLELDKE